MSRRFAKLMLQIKTVHFYTVLESSTYLLNTSLTRMNVFFFFTLGDLMKEVKNFFLHRHLLGVDPSCYPNSSNSFVSSWLQKMLRIPKRKKTEKSQKYDNTSLLCFIILRCLKLAKSKDRWTHGHWKKIPCVLKKTLLQPQHFLSTCKAQAVKPEWMHEKILNIENQKRKTDFLLKVTGIEAICLAHRFRNMTTFKNEFKHS